MRRLAHAWLLAVIGPGCNLTTDFTLRPVAETSDALCDDDRDNDFNGLSDCQDWSCVDRLPCCDIPEVLLVDDFEGGPACADAACTGATCAGLTCGPDETLWHTWPCPFPQVCDGALRIRKTQCFASGVLSRAAVGLSPGLRVEVDVQGAPEVRGYLEVALTLKDESDLEGSLDDCGRLQEIAGFASARVVAVGAGAEIHARFQSRDIGVSPLIADPVQVHTLALGVDRERRITFSLDGVVFAAGDEPVPVSDVKARLALAGITQRAAFAGVRVQAGLRCHAPSAFVPSGGSVEAAVVLAPDAESLGSWDRDEVFHPALRRTEQGDELYYTGCRWPTSESGCDPLSIAIGLAVADGDGVFRRDPANPVIVQDEVPGGSMSGYRGQMQVDVLDGLEPGYLSPGVGTPVFLLDGLDAGSLTGTDISGAGAGWDADDTCCAAFLRRDGTTWAWYAGRPSRDALYRIGLGTATDGLHFARDPGNPVLSLGPSGSFDAAGVNQPTVIWDERLGLFRMWYEGRDFFGETTIGYAVSVDGAVWHRYPGNPVLTADAVGLSSIGGPEAVLEPDGRLRLYVAGTTRDRPQRAIYLLKNEGALIEP